MTGEIVPCTDCGEDRQECGCCQECADCHRPVGLVDCDEWPHTGVIRCWPCAHSLIERMSAALDEISTHSVCCDARHIADGVWGKAAE